MITTKFPTLNWAIKTPFRMSVLATLISLVFAGVINAFFLSPAALPMTLLITLMIAAPMSYLTIKTVVSMRETIEDQKVKLALEHERADILSKFMRDAAHEFKTPLALMATNLYLVEKTPDAEKKQEYTRQTYDQIQTLNTLLETILILTRLDSTDKAAYPREWVKLSELISDIRAFNSSGRITLLTENADSLARLQVNLADLHLALKQIIENALRYSPPESLITIQSAIADHWFTLQIVDTGEGMTAETLPYIFDRFYRIDDSHTTRGLGLGLAIAKRVFDLHDGHIEVQSTLGKGTTVKTYLPLSRQ